MAKIINGSTIYLALANYLATNAYINDTAQDALVMVAKWIDEAPEVNGWIPVTERFPEDGETVLVYGSRGGIYTAWCNRRYKNVGWHKLNSKSHYCNPTHWMPLPEPPKEVE